MYETISKAIKNEFEEPTPQSIEDAYEQLYRYTSRLSDMDDFDTKMLQHIKTLSETKPFDKAFEEVVNTDYEFCNFDYFKEAFNYVKPVNLEQALDKSLKSRQPSVTWNSEINWMVQHLTIEFEGTQYTIDQLKSQID